MIVVDTSALLDKTALKLVANLGGQIAIPNLVFNELNKIKSRRDKSKLVDAAEKVLAKLDYDQPNIDLVESVDHSILEFAKGHSLFTLDGNMAAEHQGEVISWPQLEDIFPVQAGDIIDITGCKVEQPNQQICRSGEGYPVLMRHVHGKHKSARVQKVILRQSGALIVAKPL